MGKDKNTGHIDGKGFSSMFGRFSTIIEKLAQLVEKGEDLSREGRFDSGNKKVKGEYKWSAKFGINEPKGGKKPEPESRTRDFNKVKVREVREPQADLFEEDEYTLVVAEMPGINTEDVKISIKDDVLTINAQKEEKRYKKEILLPRSYLYEKISHTCNNGILEIKCMNL